MMRFNYEATLMAPAGRDWLRQTRAATVLHVFRRACNLVNIEGLVVSLLTEESDIGPFGVVILGGDASLRDLVTAGAPISLVAGHLCVGELVIDCRPARLWHPRPQWEALTVAQLRGWLPRLREWLGDRPAVELASLSPNFESLAADLAGRGPGLTPAGDDFLMGVLYALWVGRPPGEGPPVAGAIAATAAPRTTTLSGAWLRAAARGEAGRPWHQLVAALVEGEQTVVQAAVHDVLSVGHTSGADALAGFTYAIYALARY